MFEKIHFSRFDHFTIESISEVENERIEFFFKNFFFTKKVFSRVKE